MTMNYDNDAKQRYNISTETVPKCIKRFKTVCRYTVCKYNDTGIMQQLP